MIYFILYHCYLSTVLYQRFVSGNSSFHCITTIIPLSYSGLSRDTLEHESPGKCFACDVPCNDVAIITTGPTLEL